MFIPYTILHILEGAHSAKVNAVAFSPSATYLACAADDASITIWDVERGTLLQTILLQAPVLSVLWHKGEKNTLFFGCQDGAVSVIETFDPMIENKANCILMDIAGPVYALDSEPISSYLAIAVGSDVQIAKRVTEDTYATFVIMPSPSSFVDIEEETDDRVRPVSLHLLPGGRKLIASYLNHGIICWDIMKKRRLWSVIPSHRHHHIGSSALSPDIKHILVFNLRDGMDLYQFRSPTPVQSFKYPPDPQTNYAMKVGFLDEGRSVICGTHQGQVKIWDVKTGIQQQTLEHDGNLVQAICFQQAGDFAYIAAAECNADKSTGGCFSVRLWKAKYPPQGWLSKWQTWFCNLPDRLDALPFAFDSVEIFHDHDTAISLLLSVSYLALLMIITTLLFKNASTITDKGRLLGGRCVEEVVEHYWAINRLCHAIYHAAVNGAKDWWDDTKPVVENKLRDWLSEA